VTNPRRARRVLLATITACVLLAFAWPLSSENRRASITHGPSYNTPAHCKVIGKTAIAAHFIRKPRKTNTRSSRGVGLQSGRHRLQGQAEIERPSWWENLDATKNYGHARVVQSCAVRGASTAAAFPAPWRSSVRDFGDLALNETQQARTLQQNKSVQAC
jgi:hypothetical protein